MATNLWINSQLEAGHDTAYECQNFIIGDGKSVARDDMPSISGRWGIGPFSTTSISENIKLLHDDSPEFCLLKDVLRRSCVLSQVESTDSADGDHGEARENDSTQSMANCSSAAPTPSKPDHGQKRQRQEKGNSGESEDERGVSHSKRSKGSQPKGVGRPRFLACPFWKLDPVKHYDCFSKKTGTINRVKQHMSRQHSADFYCQRCYEIFLDAEARDRHVLSVWCAPRDPSAMLDGVSHDQKTQLSRKSKGSAEDQWYAMWNILFPGRQRPSSIYIDPDQSEDFCRIKEFSQREGVTILRDQLRTSGIFPRPRVTDDQLEETIRRGMDSMFQAFRPGTISTATQGSARFDHNEPGASSQSTHQGVPVDSGENSGAMLQSLPPGRSTRNDTTSPLHGSIHERVPLQRVTEDQQQVDINTAVEPSATESLHGGADDLLVIPHGFNLGTWDWKSQDFDELLQNMTGTGTGAGKMGHWTSCSTASGDLG